jgi:cytochrome b pre-mRNA-processing protein 3
MLKRLFDRPPEQSIAAQLYRAVVEQARQPVFYTGLCVPDTVDGRFELVALHAFLVLHRLKGEGAAAQLLGQALFDLMFADMDQNLREMGAGDLGVGPRVKIMAKAFYGRIAAYENGLAATDETLAAALRRNLYGTLAPAPVPMATDMAAYLRREAAALAASPLADLLAGRLTFGAVVSATGAGSAKT